MERMDIMLPREYKTRDGETKTAWTKLGVAWPMKSGNGYRLVLEQPIPPSLDTDQNGNVRGITHTAMMMEPRKFDDDRQPGKPRKGELPPASDTPNYSADGDNIPF